MAARKKARESRNRIFIVDDHPIMREGLVALIANETSLEVCGQANNAAETMRFLETARPLPDLILLDVTLPDKSGLELTKDLKAVFPDLRILILSMHEEQLYAERVLRAGARGYVMKHEGGRVLLDAIKTVLQGNIHLSQTVASRILEALSGQTHGEENSELRVLTDRELEVFNLIGEGMDSAQIATQLHISPKTVDVHKSHIRRKLNLRSSADLIRHAVRRAAIRV